MKNKKCNHKFHFIEKIFEGGGITYEWKGIAGYIPTKYEKPSKTYYKFYCEKCGKIELKEVSQDEI